MRRFSRGTPYILPSADIQNALRSLTPHTEKAIAAVLGITSEDWQKLEDGVKVRHLIDYQNSSVLAATLVQGARAHADLDALAFPITELTDDCPPASELRITQRSDQ